MSLDLSFSSKYDKFISPKLCRNTLILGVGGAGNNLVHRLTEAGVVGAECIAINTDRRHLESIRANGKILLGEKVTGGFGTGGSPELGRRAFEESSEEMPILFDNVDIAFVTAGLGGGTGTAVAPMIAEMARRSGAIVFGVVTMPFKYEEEKLLFAAQGLMEMRRVCNTLVVVDNNKALGLVPETMANSASLTTDDVLLTNMAMFTVDDIVTNLIKGVNETMSIPSLMNIDFEEFKTIIENGGVGLAGLGESNSQFRAEEAAQSALKCPLLDMESGGPEGALVLVSGDQLMSLSEASSVAEIITESLGSQAPIIMGASVDQAVSGYIRVILTLVGMKAPQFPVGLGGISMNLYDMELSSEGDQNLKLDLDLYQLEDG